jgi:hypothetical protein
VRESAELLPSIAVAKGIEPLSVAPPKLWTLPSSDSEEDSENDGERVLFDTTLLQTDESLAFMDDCVTVESRASSLPSLPAAASVRKRKHDGAATVGDIDPTNDSCTVQHLASLDPSLLSSHLGSKTAMFVAIARACLEGSEKLLVFSQSVAALNLLAVIVERELGLVPSVDFQAVTGES